MLSANFTQRSTLTRYIPSIVAPWGDIAVTHVQVLVNAEDAPEEAFKEQDALINQCVTHLTS